MKRTLRQNVLADLLGQYNLVLRPNKRSFILKCPEPECGKDKLYVEKATGRCICFHCGLKGYADYVLSEILSLPIQDLSESLYGDTVAPGTSPLLEDDEFEDWYREYDSDDVFVESNKVSLPEVLPSPDHYRLDGSLGETYLAGRGIPLEIAKEYGITYDRRARRVVFPVVVDSILRGWQARTIDEGVTPKILTFGELGGKCLMFQDRLRGSDHAILCEGPVDALKCHIAGGNVATMGKGVTPQQIRLILSQPGLRKLYVAIDPDAADDAMRVIREATGYDDIKIYMMMPPEGVKDLGLLTFQEAYEVYRSAPRVSAGQVFVHF